MAHASNARKQNRASQRFELLGYSNLLPFQLWLDIHEFNHLRATLEHQLAHESDCWADWLYYHNLWGYKTGIRALASLLRTDCLKRAVLERRILAREVAQHAYSCTKAPARLVCSW